MTTEEKYNSQFDNAPTQRMGDGGGNGAAQSNAAGVPTPTVTSQSQPDTSFPTAQVLGGVGFLIVVGLLVYLSVMVTRLQRKRS